MAYPPPRQDGFTELEGKGGYWCGTTEYLEPNYEQLCKSDSHSDVKKRISILKKN